MLKSGGVDAGEALPKFFRILRRESEDYLGDVYRSIERSRAKAASSRTQWFEDFMEGGVEDSLSRFYLILSQITSDSKGGAVHAGKALASIVDSIGTAMLAVKETVDYVNKEGERDNFLTKLFGKPEANTNLDRILSLQESIRGAVVATKDRLQDSSLFTKTLDFLSDANKSTVRSALAIPNLGLTGAEMFASSIARHGEYTIEKMRARR